jgi:hypothetical protein
MEFRGISVFSAVFLDSWTGGARKGSIKTDNGDLVVFGFSPKSGPPGSVNHKRAFTILDPVTPSAFRLKGKEMAGLVQAFIKKGTVPSADIRPQFERARPAGLLGGATAAGY